MLGKRKFIILLTLLVVVSVYFAMHQSGYNEKTGGARPVITFDSNIVETTIANAEEELMKGVKAYDEEDGDVTASVLVESISKFTTPGKSIVTYAAFDSSNHITSATREVVYTDYTAPKITLLEPLKFIYTSSLDITESISAYDSMDGDISDRIKYTFKDSGDNLATVGKHNIIFTVSNSMGDVATLEIPVEIYTETYMEKINTPKIYLNEYLVYAKTGDTIDFSDCIKYVMIGNETIRKWELRSSGLEIEIDRNDLDMKTPGVYSVTYSLETLTGYRGMTDLIVVVEE